MAPLWHHPWRYVKKKSQSGITVAHKLASVALPTSLGEANVLVRGVKLPGPADR